MLVVSYDISNDKLRTKFSKMLEKNGAIRLQYSVYEINNTKRIVDNVKLQIEQKFAKQFGGEDSIILMEVNENTTKKYGNAIHRDQAILYF